MVGTSLRSVQEIHVFYRQIHLVRLIFVLMVFKMLMKVKLESTAVGVVHLVLVPMKIIPHLWLCTKQLAETLGYEIQVGVRIIVTFAHGLESFVTIWVEFLDYN